MEAEKRMNFRECYMHDMETFFDIDELAEVHMIDGKECNVVLEEQAAVDARGTFGRKVVFNPKETAVNKNDITLFARDAELRQRVSAGALMSLDGKKYFVQSVQRMHGIVKIALGIHKV